MLSLDGEESRCEHLGLVGDDELLSDMVVDIDVVLGDCRDELVVRLQRQRRDLGLIGAAVQGRGGLTVWTSLGMVAENRSV